MLDAAAALGIAIVPIIHHLEQLEGTGIFKHHPELDAGVDPRNAQLHYFKLEHPALREILGKWFTDLARYPSVRAITVWLSEDAGKHQLSDPAKNDFVVEAELMQAALDIARKVKPELRLRLLLTQASYASNDQILAVARPDTQIIYYDGSRTYNSTKAPMMPDNLKRYAAAGGWLGVCPQLIPEWRGVAPWHGGEFVQYRMQEFAAAGVKTLVGYAPPARRYSEYNLEAAAEWSWNPTGRDPRGFAHSYAVRRQRADPSGFAQWAGTLGPAAWDLYGSRVIVHWCYGSSVPSVLDGSFKLGQGVLLQLPDENRLTADEAAAERAREMAIGLGDPQLVRESVAVGSWLNLLHDMLRLSALLPRAKDLSEVQRAEVQRLLASVDKAAGRTARALTEWCAGVDAAVGQTPQGRASDTINCVLDEARDLAAAGEKLGFPDTRKAYRRAKVGSWDTADFDHESPLGRTIEVTDRMGGVGHYEVDFAYTAGLLGLVAQRAALAVQTGDDEQTRQEVSVDEHRSHCGAWNENNLYHLELKEAPEGRRYFLVLRIQGGNPTTPREQRTTHGDIYFRLLEPQP
ncbi:MAG: hypothetical protein HYU66_12690 [Armatimonadetes bacterium]|nr:hypothetical protein [Armatimonadota bacterium]